MVALPRFDALRGVNLEALELEVARELCMRSLAEFFVQSWHVTNPGTPLAMGPHIKALCDHIQWQLEDRARAIADPSYTMRAQNLLINIPPRSLKTTVLVCATIWCWLREPTTKIMYLSANPRVAQGGARMSRDLIVSPWFQRTMRPEWQVRDDQEALMSMGNTAGGNRIARGLDSTITGEGADWLCIDDPHDMRDTAHEIRMTIEGYIAAVHNRVNDGARTSIRTAIMQRFLERDFSGAALETKDWLHLRLPAEFENEAACACGTCVGENVYGWQDWRSVEGERLHERLTPEFLAAEKIRLGSVGYAGQMQQRPLPAGGGIFELECFSRRWRELPEAFDRVVIVLDASFKAGTASDYAVIQVWGSLKAERYLIEQWRKQADFVDTLAALQAVRARYPFAKILIEDAANGVAIIAQLRREIPGVVAVKPDGGKRSRALSVQGIVESCAVILPEHASWLGVWLHEVCSFTGNGDVHDDQVDAMTYALRELQDSGARARFKALSRV